MLANGLQQRPVSETWKPGAVQPSDTADKNLQKLRLRSLFFCYKLHIYVYTV